MKTTEERIEYRKEFGKKLKKFRVAARVFRNNRQMFSAGFSESSIARYESGEREMRIYDFLTVANELNLSKEEFIDMIAPGKFMDK